jgi:hypothetical protein
MKRFRTKQVRQKRRHRAIKASSLGILFFIYGASVSFAQEASCSMKQGNAGTHSLITASGSSAFKASLNEAGNVTLNWTTAAGANNSHFIMQRSVDGSEFNDAALLFATEGNQNTSIRYRYTDNINLVKAKRIYYRIKMVNAAGKITYTAPVQISLEKTKGQKENTAYYPVI